MAARLNERTLVVLAGIVASQPGISPSALADAMGVTTRSIRTYVRQFNGLDEPCAHLDLTHGGYRLSVDDPGAFAAWRDRLQAERSRVPDAPEERVSYLVSDLLSRTDWVTLDTLASILFCSSRTVSNDLRQVETYLAPFGLKLEKRPHYGIRVNGSEMKRRVCLANNVLNRMSPSLEGVITAEGGATTTSSRDGGSKLSTERGASYAPLRHDFHLDIIAACVDQALEETDFHVSAVSYQNLLVHIAIAVERIRAGRFVPLDPASEKGIRRSEGWHAAECVARAIERALNVSLPDGEVAYIAIHLAGKQALLPERPLEYPADSGVGARPSGDIFASSSEGETAGEPLVVADEAWNLVSSMIEIVRQVFHFDLRDDLELRMNLARHIVPLSVRLKYHMRLENPLCGEIKVRYPLAFSFAREAARVLVEAYGEPVSDDEVSYLALSFALAVETKKAAQQRPKNILIVCASGLGSARLLEIRCREEFGDHLGTIVTADVSQLGTIDFSTIDYVFSTVHIDRVLPVPVREVGFFLDEKDIDGLRPLLHTGVAETSSSKYFSPDLFFPHMPARTREQVLRFMCDRISMREEVPDDYIEQIRARERTTSTAFGNNVAMPHPLVPVGKRTFVAVGLADGPIAWGDKSVSAVFLVTVSTDSGEDLHVLYDALLGVTSDADAVSELLSDQRFETLRRLLDGGMGREVNAAGSRDGRGP